ncbi:MAG: porin [Rhodospirillaceae bacterium]|nr:porin [Rhodospirillaceae bacterium]
MRSLFLTTSGLMTAALAFAATAQAEEPIKLGVGGKLRQYFFITDQNNQPGQHLNESGMLTDAEIYFDGKTVLDNGLTVRAVIEIEAEARNDRNADELYIDFISGFGKLRVGEKEGINATIVEDPAPQAFLTTEEEVLGDAMRARTGVTVKDAFTFKRYVGDVLGITYETPAVIPGVAFGFTYHPSTSDAEGTLDNATSSHDAIDVSGRYEYKFTGGKFRVATGYFHSSSRFGGTDGNEAWSTTVEVAYAGWDFAGSYIASNPANSRDERAWTAGAMYSIGPYKISAHQFHGTREPTPNAVRKEVVDRTTVQGSYKLGPGIVIGLTGFYVDQSDAAGVSYDGVGMLGGAKLAF